MRVSILQDIGQVAVSAADLLRETAAAQPELVLGLPTGRTAAPLYAELARRHRRGELDLGRARAFNLDELVLPGDHPASFRTFMERHAWRQIGLDPERCDIPDGEASDVDRECERYDRALAAAGGLDLVFLGVGEDGHVAYNLPGPAHETTHLVELPDHVADSLEGPVARRPVRALTMGFGPLEEAAHLVLLAVGEAKSAPIRKLLDGPTDTRWPCTLLREHPHLDVLLDPAARGELEPA